MTALIVIAEPGTRHHIADQLQDRGMQVTVAGTVAEAKSDIATQPFLVAIVDLALPDGSGLEVLDALRASGSAAHVIVLSASPAEHDQVEARRRGADEVIQKPFSLSELIARAFDVCGRPDPGRDNSVIQVGRCAIDLRSRQVTCGGQVIDLTAKEFDLFAYLAVRPGHVFSREQLLNAVWRSASEWQQPATVTEHVRRLRNKVELDPRKPQILITVRGAGYRLDLPRTTGAEPARPDPRVRAAVFVHVDGQIVFADEAAAELVGVDDVETLVGMQTLELAAPISQVAATQRLADGRAGRLRRSEVMQLLRADGAHVAVEVRSSPVEWQGQLAGRFELTPLPDPSARLRRMVTGVLAEVTDAVIITDVHGHIRSWNSAAERIYGWTEASVLGRHVLDVLLWDGDEGQLVHAWEQLGRTGRWSGEFTQVTRDGSTVDILGSKTALEDEDGAPIGAVSVNRLADVAGRAPMSELDTELAARIQQGIDEHEFVVHYQPIVDLADGHLLALEALVRWEHPDRGILAPAEFLDAAERSGYIVELGEFVVDTACRQAAAWRRSGADILLWVNVSTRQLTSSSLTDRFSDILHASGFDPACLWLEVTETAVVEELDRASASLGELVELGVGVSIDDFGTGWASLTYLQSFPVHALKIDGTFVAGAGNDDNNTAIVRSILSLGAELGLAVVAEGIETATQRDVLRAMGATVGQGYLYGHPTPAAEVPIERARRIPHVMARGKVIRVGTHAPGRSTDDRAAVLVELLDRKTATLAAGAGSSAPAGSRLGNLPPVVAAERIESDAVATLLRGLLRVNSAPGAADLLHRTIRKMGGSVVPVALAGENALPIDVSLGEGPSLLVDAEPFTVSRMQLERLLPRMVEDARQAVDLLRRTERLQDDTTRDSLTGLGNRRVLERVLPRSSSGSIVMIDLDHFKEVNDEHGHAVGDEILRSFGRVLADQVRAQDTTCRLGGEEFVILLADLDLPTAVAMVERLRTAWAAASPLPVTFSAGVAAIAPDGGTAALIAADGALYRAKDLGRDQTAISSPADGPDGHG